ncbi:hypothetical protein QA601_13625 [Chitinispirillales bacterium ANBcel5]|uniref:hypothetical protein n=1 Tax=Cellulosispirillum alkaliphilum TaxID=3039283 RepID=UPI002A583BA0|nr:hypothetical protein [Chitinispirillales bacterium ANBcel5]
MKKVALLISAVLVTYTTGLAQSFGLNIDNGEAKLWRFVSDEREQVEESSVMAVGDSLFLDSEQSATINLEENTRLLFRGKGALSLSIDNSSLSVHFDEGQILIDRNSPEKFSDIVIHHKGYDFTLEGTAVAIRSTRQGKPTAAVIRGSVQMSSQSGESLTILAGQFGAVDESGSLSSGDLSERAIQSLESWAGLEAESTEKEVADAIEADETEESFTEQLPETQDLTVDEQETETENIAEADGSALDVAEDQPASTDPVQPVSVPAEQSDDTEPQQPTEEKTAEEPETETVAAVTTAPPQAYSSSPNWEFGAGIVTVDGQQWTRLNLGVDVPIWKFGVFFDLEFFIDEKGDFSDKGWNFKDNWAEALARKVRYVRFGSEEDPLFVKFGALSNVTFGYGFVVDRFTNMLRYPDQRLPGLQLYVNDVSKFGITAQTLVADFLDFRNDGGVMAGRLAFRPFKTSQTPIVNGISIGATYATDRNMYAPAREWKAEKGAEDLEKIIESGELTENVREFMENRGINPDKMIADLETLRDAQKRTESFSIIGGDIGIPLIRNPLLSLDLYAQGATRQDRKGWGIGAPGISLNVWRLWASLEYRRVQGKFQPGHFDTYYLEERLRRDPLSTKVDHLKDDTLNGVFGRMGFNIANVLVVDGAYQYMIGKKDDNKDQRFEASATIGSMIMERIPKLNRAEAYYQKTRIGSDFRYNRDGERRSGNDSFFSKTPYTYYGYRTGFEIAEGASLVLDYRYGFKVDQDQNLVSDNHVSILTAITF